MKLGSLDRILAFAIHWPIKILHYKRLSSILNKNTHSLSVKKSLFLVKRCVCGKYFGSNEKFQISERSQAGKRVRTIHERHLF